MKNQFNISLPTQEEINRIKKEFPPGTVVELTKWNDPYVNLPIGTKGVVTNVDDIGTIHCDWETGNHLGIAYNEDSCKKIKQIQGFGFLRSLFLFR